MRIKSKYNLILALSMCLCGCQDKDEPNTDPVNQRPEWKAPEVTHVAEAPQWNVDLPASDSKPEWSDPDFNLYPSSMTAVIQLPELMRSYQLDEDMLAAFIGDECRGIGSVQIIDGKRYGFVNVKGADTESGRVVFRYYFDQLHTMLTADDNVAFKPDMIYGTVSNPVIPNFMPADCHDIYLQINPELIEYNTGNDRLSIFVDNVCRGYSFDQGNGKYHTMVLAEPEEMAVIRYYNDKLSYIFESKPVRIADLLKSNATKYADATLETKRHFPLLMQMLIALPDDLARSSSNQDLMAAFVGSECRGVATIIDYGGEQCFSLIILNGLEDTNRLVIKYYCSATCRTYQSKPYIFEHDKQIGLQGYPEYPYFTAVDE